ncbi:MAG: XRE family transcriptional regulator [Candidatus Binataceae bacterium]
MSTDVEEEFRRRLRLIMQQFGSVADLAKAVGVSDNAIYKWVSGRGQPSMASLVNLAQAAGVSVEWLATGHGLAAKATIDSPPLREASATVAPPREAIALAGSAALLRSAQIVDHLNFSADWLRRQLGVESTQVALIEALGDSMSPTIDEGDLCLIDLRVLRVRHDGLYVLHDGADLSIKRLQREADGAIMVRSDNQAYNPQRVTAEEIAIAGRVIWLGGRP